MNNPDHISECLKQFFEVKILKFFYADPGSGMGKIRMRDPGWEKYGSGINIPDPDLDLDRWRDLQGEERMLALCWSHIWWAGLDSTSFKHQC
jgi:hypothetical protein